MAAIVAGTPTTADSGSTNVTSITVDAPAGLADGDLLVAAVFFQNNSGDLTSGPAGWTKVGSSAAPLRPSGFYVLPLPTAAGTAASFTFTTTGSAGRALAACFRVTGADLSAYLDVVSAPSSATGTTSCVLPSMTTTGADRLILGFSYTNTGSGTAAPTVTSADLTLVATTLAAPASSSVLWVGSSTQATAGATGTRTMTYSPAVANSGGYMIAIAPAPVTSQTVSPVAIDTAEALGSPAVSAMLQAAPTGLATEEVLGAPVVTTALQTAPSGIGTEEAFGTPVAAVPISATADGIPTAEEFYAPALSWPVSASADGIASAEAFGAPVVIAPTGVSPQGIPGGGTLFGFPTAAVQDLSQVVNPTGIASAGAFGAPAAGYGAVTASPAGIPSLERFGTPRRDSVVVLHPADIPSDGNVFGAPTVRPTITLEPTGLESQEGMGLPQAIMVALLVRPLAIDTQEFFGVPRSAGGSSAVPYEMDGAMPSRRYSGRLSGLGTITQKPNRWEGTLG